MRMIVGRLDPQMQRSDSLALDALDVDVDAVDADRRRDPPERVEAGPRVEERREQHVAGQASHAVEVGDPAQSRPRAIRAAIVPAPSPSSMPTTASPAAHDASMALRAVVPPCAEP